MTAASPTSQELPLAGMRFDLPSTQASAISALLLEGLGARTGSSAHATDGPSVALAGGLNPFGERGRFAGGPDHDSAVEAIGGALMAQFTYEPGPAYLVTPFATVAQGVLAALAALAASAGRAPARSVSGIDGLFGLESGPFCFGEQPDASRWFGSPRGPTPTNSSYEARDGWFNVAASTVPFIRKVLNATGLDDLATSPRFEAGPVVPFRDPLFGPEVQERLTTAVRGMARDKILAALTVAGVPAGPVLTIEEALGHPHVAEAGLIAPDEQRLLPGGLLSVRRRGQSRFRGSLQPGASPLAGMRVIELASYVSGPYAGRLLADLGADVIKIEPPGGDPFRAYANLFVAWNHGKRSITLNLREKAARQQLLELVGEADILVTNYQAAALERMRLDRDTLFTANPALIYCALSAFGDHGPLAQLPGFDVVVQGFVGIMKRQGAADPVRSQINATDYLAGMLAALGVLGALIGQERHGGGAEVVSSLLAAGLLLNYWVLDDLRAGRPYLVGGRDYKGPHALNAAHAAHDGWLLTVRPEARVDEPRWAAARAYLASGVKQDSVAAAISRLAALEVPAVPCIAPTDLLDEPHFRDNDLWCTVAQPELGLLRLPRSLFGATGPVPPAPPVAPEGGAPLNDLWTGAMP